MSIGLTVLMLAGGCAKKDLADDLDATPATTVTAAPTAGATDTTTGDTATTELPKVEAYVASDYVTLGKYKGVEVAVTTLTVTEEDITNQINEDLAANATQEEVTGRAVETGDTVNIDFEGLLDGVAFDGGTAAGYDLEIGSGSFVPGFEEGLIGAKVGDKLAVDLTFPEDYAADLAGKAVVFNVTINSISKTVIPELTEDYVTTNTDYKTIDEYKAGVRTELEATNKDTMENEKGSNALVAVIDASTVSTIPQTLTDYYTAQANYQIEQMAAQYGVDKATYMTQTGLTQEQIDSFITDSATRDLIINAIAQLEKLEATDEEYKEAVTNYMSYYQVTTEEELLAQVTEAEIKDSVIMKKAYDFIVENAVVTNTTATN